MAKTKSHCSDQEGKRSKKEEAKGPRYLGIAGTILALAGTLVGNWQKVLEIMHERYGPDVVVAATPTALPKTDLDKGRSLLYEYRFKSKNAKRLSSDRDVELLFKDGGVVIDRCHCNKQGNYHLYTLSVAVQNNGGEKAKDYVLGISFSGPNSENVDPGVRILQTSSDALKRSYIYQSDNGFKLYSCIRESNHKEHEEDDESEHVDELCRRTYRKMGLTRDMAIFTGNLEAHIFQTIELVIAVPNAVDTFAILYNVECANCRWFYKNEILGQRISLR